VANVTLVDTTTDVTNLPSLDLTPVTEAIANLNDFDPATDVVANVALVDVTTDVTNLPSLDLTPVTDAIAALNDFDPATDVVANVALVDVTTDVTNLPSLDLTPVTDAIANLNDFDPVNDTVAHVSLVDTLADDVVGTSGYLIVDIHSRLEEQVEEGPVMVLPAPAIDQTTAWCLCYDENGLPEEGVSIYVQCVGASGTSAAYDTNAVIMVSNVDGVAAGGIPRGANLSFEARRGQRGRRVSFVGVDADTLALPALLGTP